MNKHHKEIDRYAEDCKSHNKPWLLWRIRRKSEEWTRLHEPPIWLESLNYERIPRTIRIGEYDVPEPLRVAPSIGTTVYSAAILIDGLYGTFTWCDGITESKWLNYSILHLTKEAAILHSTALISLTQSPNE